MSETLETKARRIGDDVAAVWNKIQEKGGMLPHHLNTENLVDVLNQIGAVDKWNALGAFFYTPAGFYDFYTTHEVNRMEELPEAPEGLSWGTTLSDLKTLLENNSYIIVTSTGVYPFDTELHFDFTGSAYKTVTIALSVDGAADNVMLNWGDGTMQVLTSSERALYTHTYSDASEYNLDIIINGSASVHIYNHNETVSGIDYFSSGRNMFGTCSSTSSNGYKTFICLKSIVAGPKTTFERYSMDPGNSSSMTQNSKLENIFYTYNPTTILPMSGASIASYQMPSTATGFILNKNGPFAYCSNLTSFARSSGLTVIPERCFDHAKLATFDFDGVRIIGSSAFASTKLAGQLDLSTVEWINETAFVSCTGITGVTLNDNMLSVGVGMETDMNWNYTQLSGQGAFSSCTSLSSVNLPSRLVTIAHQCFEGTLVDPTTLTFPQGLKTIGALAFASQTFYSFKDAANRLPDGLEKLGGFPMYRQPSTNMNWPEEDCAGITWPSGLQYIGTYFARYRTMKNLTLPDNVTFQNASLQSVWITDTLTLPANATFNGSAHFTGDRIKKLVVQSNSAAGGYNNNFYIGEIEFTQNVTNPGGLCWNITGGYDGTSTTNYVNVSVPSTVTTFGGQNFSKMGSAGRMTIAFEGQVPDSSASQIAVSYGADLVLDMSNCATIPVFSNSNALGGTNKITVIVPDTLYNDWVAETHWADFISRGVNVIKASEV